MPVFNPGVLYSDSRFKVTVHTYNVATASGNQTLTGAGFTPKAAVIFANISATVTHSIGLTNGTTHSVVLGNGAAGNFNSTDGSDICLQPASGNYALGALTFNSDGGVIAWTKQASPTGTANIYVMWFR